jgi:hypothetical protein
MKVSRWLKTGIALFSLLVGAFGSWTVHADGIAASNAAPRVQVLHQQTEFGDFHVVRIALDSDGFEQVNHPRLPLHHIDLQVVHRAGGAVLIGRRVISVQRGEVSQTLFEEVSVRVPHYRFSMGWDVKALERELERLGIKVKPPASAPAPRPVPPATGGA